MVTCCKTLCVNIVSTELTREKPLKMLLFFPFCSDTSIDLIHRHCRCWRQVLPRGRRRMGAHPRRSACGPHMSGGGGFDGGLLARTYEPVTDDGLPAGTHKRASVRAPTCKLETRSSPSPAAAASLLPAQALKSEV